MRRYVKRPVVVETVQWTGVNGDEIIEFAGREAYFEDGELYISTLEGIMKAPPRGIIIKGVEGEFYPCELSIFQKTYIEEK